MSDKAKWKPGICAAPDPDPDAIYLAVGRALTAWERLDTSLLMTFGFIIGTTNVAAMRALGRIESPASRIVVLREAFRSTSATLQSRLVGFDEILKQVENLADGRNAIAHGQVQQIKMGDRPGGWYLAPGLSTTRKVNQFTKAGLDNILTAQTEAEIIAVFFSYAMGAARIAEYEAEFARLFQAVKDWNLPAFEMSLA